MNNNPKLREFPWLDHNLSIFAACLLLAPFVACERRTAETTPDPVGNITATTSVVVVEATDLSAYIDEAEHIPEVMGLDLEAAASSIQVKSRADHEVAEEAEQFFDGAWRVIKEAEQFKDIRPSPQSFEDFDQHLESVVEAARLSAELAAKAAHQVIAEAELTLESLTAPDTK